MVWRDLKICLVKKKRSSRPTINYSPPAVSAEGRNDKGERYVYVTGSLAGGKRKRTVRKPKKSKRTRRLKR